MREADWPAVAAIYAEGIATGLATFETAVPEYGAWDRAHLAEHRLVADQDGSLAGWAALSPVSARAAYAGVAEETIYVAAAARGRGLGSALLDALVAGSEAGGIWTLQAAIFAENGASIALHARCGFRVVGTRERIGELHGTWRDVVLMERRSTVVG
jgi:phosphinothricin acetyltransferase